MSRAANVHAHVVRRRLLLAGILAGGAVVIGRGVQLTVLEHNEWLARAVDQQHEQHALPAPRGVIYDRNGVPLAASREVFRIAVAPREIDDTLVARERLQAALGLKQGEARRLVASRRRWVVLPQRYDALARNQLEGLRGFYFERSQERFYPRGEIALELLGAISTDGRPLGGIEQELDTVLRGRPGIAVARRDARGHPMPGALTEAQAATPGRDVFLTIDADLQEIAEQAIGSAMKETGAQGGDLVIADPRSGEILAAVSRRSHGARQWRGATEPYEPGSTLKPFTVAALLAEKRATLDDSINGEQGSWTFEGRTIRDTHASGWLTLRDALRVSSNIAMAKISARLDGGTEYQYLRGFGFGTPTGIGYPAESSGMLRSPRSWSKYSQQSLAIGYEISVTPLQMAMAYGALANGGLLLEPHLVREVRERDGTRVSLEAARVIRRAIPEAVARELVPVLVDVVQEGTGTEAGMGAYQVAGKTGTARRTTGGRYESGAYTASFAGFFPAEKPQLVFLVKLDDPQSVIYGGLAAAPVTRATLTASLAAWKSPIDRNAVATPVPTAEASAAPARAVSPRRESGPFIFTLGAEPDRRGAAAATAQPVIPPVEGLSLRDAARRLHTEGFRVKVNGSGVAGSTRPAAGTAAPRGSVVEVFPARAALVRAAPPAIPDSTEGVQ